MPFDRSPHRTHRALPPLARALGPILKHGTRLLDPLCLLAAAKALSVLDHASFLPSAWAGGLPLSVGLVAAIPPLAWVAAGLSPWLLHGRSQPGVARPRLTASHTGRFLVLGCIALALGALSRTLAGPTLAWLLAWLAAAWLLTAASRTLIARLQARLWSSGRGAEVIAVVGLGPTAEGIKARMKTSGPVPMRLLGVFDDRVSERSERSGLASGDINALLELGKTQRIDWIVLALPAHAQERLDALTQRLKALAAPIVLARPQVEAETQDQQAVEESDFTARPASAYRWIDTAGSLARAQMRAWRRSWLHGFRPSDSQEKKTCEND